MTRACAECATPIYKYNRSGYCKPCYMRTPAWVAITRKAISNRVAAMSKWTISERLAKFRMIDGPDECWGWSGCHNGVGYGVMTVHGEQRMATHLALEEDGRPRPSDQHVACHSCDNPPCTNPAHLWWGTEAENMQDASAKGRLKGNPYGRRRRSAAA